MPERDRVDEKLKEDVRDVLELLVQRTRVYDEDGPSDIQSKHPEYAYALEAVINLAGHRSGVIPPENAGPARKNICAVLERMDQELDALGSTPGEMPMRFRKMENAVNEIRGIVSLSTWDVMSGVGPPAISCGGRVGSPERQMRRMVRTK